MALVVYNTLTRTKEPFRPLRPPEVGMYVCGLTVYDHAHIGHARTAVAFETIRRWLAHAGYRVTFVQNVTDIDDKIIQRAQELAVDPQAHAARWTEICNADMSRLGVSPPDHQPKVTEHLPEIIALIERLLAQGYAYRAPDGSVYYRVLKKPDYGKLSNRTPEELLAGARVEPAEGKEDPRDFALWKAAKPGEPEWPSPWGPGRPGWHIECSAMSLKYLGESFDVHGGGLDLVFPHHENEIAQSEGATGRPFVRYWFHTGFLTVGGEKMSKSLRNFVTVQDALREHDAEVIRFFYALTHYRTAIDYSSAAIDAARRGLERLRRVREELAQASERAGSASAGDATLAPAAERLRADFTQAMDDDFNTRLAAEALFEFANAANRALTQGVSGPAATQARSIFERLAGVLTLFADHASADPELEVWVVSKLREREEARKARDFARSDAIRAELVSKGIEISDSKSGTTWRKVK